MHKIVLQFTMKEHVEEYEESGEDLSCVTLEQP